jgi:hypothetical protein
VNYAHAGSSQIVFDDVPQPDGTTGRALLNAGANPPDGVVVTYVLPDNVSGAVTLAFLEADGTEIRIFTSDEQDDPPRVPAKPGVNRFVWNLRYPGPTKITATDLAPGHRDGPLVMPGTYTVRLASGGFSAAQTFEVLPDPRIQTSTEDLTAQRDFQREIVGYWSRVNELVNAVDAALAQIGPWKSRTDEVKVIAAFAALDRELLAIRPLLIDVYRKGAQLYPTGIHEKLNALLDSTDAADYAPPRQARDVVAQLAEQIAGLEERFRGLETTLVADLNRVIEEAGLRPVGVRG